MKNLSLIVTAILILSLLFSSCKKEDKINTKDIIPTNFSVDVPSAISDAASKSLKSDNDTLQGGEIYEHLRFFIKVGESSAEIVEAIMKAIGQNGLDKAMSFSYTSDDDGRVKNIVIIENSSFEGTTWQYQLTATDALSENETDGGIGMQIFWNNSPVKGIAILKSYNINRKQNYDVIGEDWAGKTGMFRIDYSEAGENNYEKQMTVQIADIPLTSDIYSMNNLKMFVGKAGDIVDVYGNSNHPQATFFSTDDTGFNWAFSATGNDVKNIGVAEVGLPLSNLNSDSRTVLLKDNSLYNVFQRLIQEAYPDASEEDIAPYLKNTAAPGYFANGGFISAGSKPNDDYTALENSMNNLTPFNPSTISSLKIEFKSSSSAK